MRTNGDGTIYKRKDGRWEGKIRIGGKRKCVYGKNRPEVLDKIRSLTWDINNNSYIEPHKKTVSEWITEYLTVYKSSLAPKTKKEYEKIFLTHIKPTIGDVHLLILQPSQIQKLYNNLQSSGKIRTIQLIHNILNTSFKQAIKNNLVKYNPCEAVVMPKIKKETVIVLSKSNQNMLLDSCKNNIFFYRVLVCALNTGMRIGEITNLNWNDIDLKNKLLKVTKAKTEKGIRSIPILDTFCEVLNQCPIKKGYVFINSHGKPYTPDGIRSNFDKALKKCGLPHIKFHALRHTFATRALEAGLNPKVVQEILGHASLSMTMDLYSHVLMNEKIKEMKKLNTFLNGRQNGRQNAKQRKKQPE